MTVIGLKDLSHEDATKMGFGDQFSEDRPVGVFVPGKATSGTKAMWAGEEISLVAAYRAANDALDAACGPNERRRARLEHARRVRISEGIAQLPVADRIEAAKRLQSLGEPPPMRLS